MKLLINGDINRYYIQTLCMIFFPGAKFSEREELSDSSDFVELNLVYTDNEVKADVVMRSGNKKEKGNRTEAFVSDATKMKAAKIACGIAVFEAGEKLFDHSPPWGILTGIRPSKIAVSLLAEGKKVGEVREILSKDYFLNPKKASLLTAIAKREFALIKKLENNTCSVYISIPFCPSRCAYCSFVSYSTKRLLSMIDRYLEQLYLDIDHMFDGIKNQNLKVLTVYIGGGTPTILSAQQIETLLSRLSRYVDPASLAEFTFEAGRPDTITSEKMKALVDGGVSRVSVNTQTLNDTILENIGRKHTAADFYNAFNIAKASGIKHINTDLIAGLPGESFASFSRSADEIIKLRPDNITFHTFCVKKSSEFLKNGTDVYSLSGGETGKGVDYSQVSSSLAGYNPYYIYRQKNTVGNFENVGFALPNTEGYYNILMMEELHTIFSVGAGAVTKLVSPDRSVIRRVAMPKYPYEYLCFEMHSRVSSQNDKIISEFFEQYYRYSHI